MTPPVSAPVTYPAADGGDERRRLLYRSLDIGGPSRDTYRRATLAMQVQQASTGADGSPAIRLTLRFDRGTILLTQPPHNLDLQKAPGVLWDPRVGAYRAAASGLLALKQWLREAHIDFEDIASPPHAADGLWEALDLRPYQEAALAAWEQAGRRGIVALPTGSGKTRLAIDAIRRTKLNALSLVPTRVLLEQWSRELAAAYKGIWTLR